MQIRFGKVYEIHGPSAKATSRKIMSMEKRHKIILGAPDCGGQHAAVLTGKEARDLLGQLQVQYKPSDSKQTIEDALLARIKEVHGNDDAKWNMGYYKAVRGYAFLHEGKGLPVHRIDLKR